MGSTDNNIEIFYVGHTFMCADSFHAKVEKEMNKMKMVCDWEDFLTCVRTKKSW